MASSSNGLDQTRGAGFVHLNTPADIQYTAGQTLSRTDLLQHRSRVECVVLPESVGVWRRAFAQYTKSEGYSSFAADAEDERAGESPVLPALVPQRSGPLRRRAADHISARDAFFCGATVHGQQPLTALDTSTTASNNTTTATIEEPPSATPSSTGGIAIISHHKITGQQRFVYPDHDGVLSAGVVPQVVTTAEEQAEEAAARVYYISALDMSEEELAALEELQTLWRSRVRSHTFLGTQHRHAAKGTADPAAQAEEEGESTQDGGRMRKAHKAEGERTVSLSERYAGAETTVDDASTVNKELAEALRLAEELLRFA